MTMALAIKRLPAGVLFFIFVSSPAIFAQLGMGNGRISGIVKDEAGRPLPAALIKVVNLAYKNTLTVESNKKGRWSVSGIAAGRYSITVRLEGYEDANIEITISLATELSHTLDVTLKKYDLGSMTLAVSPESAALAKLLQDGNQLYDEQKFQEARDKFGAFLANNPSVYRVYINVGNCYMQEKKYDQAIDSYNSYLDKAVSKKEDSFRGDETAAEVLAAVGRAYIEQQLVDKAIEYFKQAIDAFPNDEVLAYNVGEVLFNQGQPDQAIEYLLIAVKIKKSWPLPYLKLGYAYLNKGKYRMALDSLEKYVALAPQDPQAESVKNLIGKIEELAKKEILPS